MPVSEVSSIARRWRGSGWNLAVYPQVHARRRLELL
ncbi:uncharacterized protein METZ01_LOCUS505081, partial [marine metagenome]